MVGVGCVEPKQEGTDSHPLFQRCDCVLERVTGPPVLGKVGGSQMGERMALGDSPQLSSLEGPEHARGPLTGGFQGVLEMILI